MKIKTLLKLLAFFNVIVLLFLTGTLNAAGKKRIAVLNFTANNTTETMAYGIGEFVEVALFQTELFDVLERSQINHILNEQDLQNTRCEDTSCGVKIGKLLSADVVVFGSVVRLDSYTITIKYVGVKSGQVIIADSESPANEGEIKNAVNKLIERSAKKANEIIINEKTVLEPQKQKRNYYSGLYYSLGFIPGGAQAYTGHAGKTVFFLSTFVLSGIGTKFAYDYYVKKRDEYKRADYSTSRHDFNNKYGKYKNAANLAIYSAGLCGFIYILNWADVLFISKPDFDNRLSGINIKNSILSFDLNKKTGNKFENNMSISLCFKF